MRKFIKKITHPFLKLGLKLYYYKPRTFCYDGICIKVHPDVFPPHLTFSTKILLSFIKNFDLKDKTFIELGCGSGIISLFASKKGAQVTATDINKKALFYLEKNATKLNLELSILESDLFENLQDKTFNYILINPPYYPKKAKNTKEKAWFCGEHFEYFEKLFTELPPFINDHNFCYMILSEDCEIDKIKNIGTINGLKFELIIEKIFFKERNFVFQLKK